MGHIRYSASVPTTEGFWRQCAGGIYAVLSRCGRHWGIGAGSDTVRELSGIDDRNGYRFV